MRTTNSLWQCEDCNRKVKGFSCDKCGKREGQRVAFDLKDNQRLRVRVRAGFIGVTEFEIWEANPDGNKPPFRWAYQVEHSRIKNRRTTESRIRLFNGVSTTLELGIERLKREENEN